MATAPRSIIFYGNCQAGALAHVFGSHPKIAEHFTVRHLPNFDDPANPARFLPPDEVASAAVLFDQHNPVPFPHLADLPAACTTVTFPSIDFNLLWPLTRDNPYNDRSDPAVPWGEFPYGDRLLIDAIERDLELEAVLAEYHASSAKAFPQLERLEAIERARLAARDEKCEVKFADYIFETFRESQLHWCVNHPTMVALLEMGRRLLAALGPRQPELTGLAIEDTGVAQMPREPLDLINVPVHPVVANYFGLRWYSPSAERFGLYDAHLTYEGYFRRMAALSIEARRKSRQPTAADT